MSKPLGFSVYVSTFEQQKSMLEKIKGQGYPIFISLHIAEEVSADYVEKVQAMCAWLYENNFSIMADVSPYTLDRFEVRSLAELVQQLHISNLRLDFGFDAQSLEEDLKGLKDSSAVEITYNASTLSPTSAIQKDAFYMHNFYPRPETALDEGLFKALNDMIREKGGRRLAFIAGDQVKRGPIYEGLPTLEKHRYAAPYAQYVDLVREYELDAVYVGDVSLSTKQLQLILADFEDGILRLPLAFRKDYEYLYQQVFTVRQDSPKSLARVQESREFAQAGKIIQPENTTYRARGSITIDNERYKRYSGEIQITKEAYPADKRVNVIGRLAKEYHLLLNHLRNGEQFMFVKK